MPQAPIIKFPRVQIKELIQELTGAPCIWDNEPQSFYGQVGGKPGYWAELSLVATGIRGIDEERIATLASQPYNVTTQVSYSIETIQVKVLSYDKDLPSFDIASQIRRGIRALTGRSQHNQAGLSFVGFDKTMSTTIDKDNRQASHSVFSVRLNWLVAVDPGDADGTTIGSVESITPNLTP